MTEEEMLQKYGEEYSKVSRMCLYELRRYAKSLGIPRVTALTKEELIRRILKIGPEAEPMQ